VTQRLMRIPDLSPARGAKPEEGFIGKDTSGIRLKKILVGCDFSADAVWG